MADFSNIDVEDLVVAWEEEKDLWHISGGRRNTTKKMQDTEHCPESKKSYRMKQGKILQVCIFLMN